MALALRFAARSDVGLLRRRNDDSAYAGPRLLAVADGMGGHVGGDVASSVVVATIAPLDEDSPGPDLLDRLSRAVESANEALGDIVDSDRALEGMGTTLTALLRAGSRLGLVHIGDSRCYLLRDGVLQQLTRDDTFVQTLVDEKRITVEEAGNHPQRSMITNAMQGQDAIDMHLSVREARAGDRYLLCSDGLSSVVSEETLRDTLAAGDPEAAAEAAVDLALRGGGPDNITLIIADVVDVDASPSDIPQVVGAAAAPPAASGPRGGPGGAAAKAARLGAERNGGPSRGAESGASAGAGEAAAPRADNPRAGRTRRWVGRSALAVVLLALAGGAGWGAYAWSQQQYYVGTDQGTIAIYQGLSQEVGPVELSSLYEVQEDLTVDDLPVFARSRIENGLPADDLDSARLIVDQLRADATLCNPPAAAPEATPTPAPTSPEAPTAVPTPARTATPDSTAGRTAVPTPTPDPTVTPFSLGPGAPAIDCGEQE
jgi:protein phosphatase